MEDTFSADLRVASRQHRGFLRAVHTCGRNLYEPGPALDNAIKAYVDDWLPRLLDEGNDPELPCVDVLWVWHLHKLDPLAYAKECNNWFGRLVDVPDGNDPFGYTSSAPVACVKTSPRFSELYDRIVACAQRQASFLWQVRWPQYDDEKFLAEAVDRYLMMLKLMKENPKQFIVPTYDMDLIWHTHMSFPIIYQKDCTRIVGFVVTHDDSVNDRAENSKLNVSSEQTENLWLAMYGTSWSKEGAMFRGVPPKWYWTDRDAGAGSGYPCVDMRSFCPKPTEHVVWTSVPICIHGFAMGTPDQEILQAVIIPGYGVFAPHPQTRPRTPRAQVTAYSAARELPPPPGFVGPDHFRFFGVPHPQPLGQHAGKRLMYRLPTGEQVWIASRTPQAGLKQD